MGMGLSPKKSWRKSWEELKCLCMSGRKSSRSVRVRKNNMYVNFIVFLKVDATDFEGVDYNGRLFQVVGGKQNIRKEKKGQKRKLQKQQQVQREKAIDSKEED